MTCASRFEPFEVHGSPPGLDRIKRPDEMTKTSRSSTVATEQSFHKHYAAIWGIERWQTSLYPALSDPMRQCALVNLYTPADTLRDFEDRKDEYERLSFPSIGAPGHVHCLVQRAGRDEGESTTAKTALPIPEMAGSHRTSQRLKTHRNLDAASVLAAHLLNVHPGETVVDLCAAPGGKSIVLTENIWPFLHSKILNEALTTQTQRQGHLTSDALDGPRYKRLTENLKASLPAELFHSKDITIHRIDGTDPLAYRRLSIGGVGYDKVLVDAPCSSERHIIHAHLAAQASGRIASEMANWRPGS